MVSTFTTNKHIEEPAHGDDVGTWDVPVNSNWSLIDTAFGGTLLLNATALTGNQALTNVQLQPPTIQISGAPSAAVTYTVPSGVGGLWVIRNTTTGGKTIGIVSLAGGSTVTIPANQQLGVWCDGSATGMLVSNSVFSSSGVTFPDGTVQSSAVVISTSDPSGATNIDFISIAATISNLEVSFSLTASAPDVLQMQFYNSVGVLDTSSVYYSIVTVNTAGTLTGSAAGLGAAMLIGGYGSTVPLGGKIWITGIQRATRTNALWQTNGISPDNINALFVGGAGARTSAGPITGIRLSNTSGATFTGHITVMQTA